MSTLIPHTLVTTMVNLHISFIETSQLPRTYMLVVCKHFVLGAFIGTMVKQWHQTLLLCNTNLEPT